MIKSFLCLLIFSSLSSVLFADLSILKPPGLRDWWNRSSADAHTSIAAFGTIPWGKKVLGTLELAEPRDACDYIRTSTDTSIAEPILIATRGNCPFYLKAHYAQLAGAQMLIIVDNQYEDVESKLMVDSSGQGESIHIPSVLLGKRAGDKLIESLTNDDETISDIQLMFDFNIPKHDKVSYNLWISSSSSQTFRFLKNWEAYDQKLDPVTEMEPHFLHFKMFGAPLNQDQNITNCICGGRYCCTDPDGDLPNTGRDVISEDLRQICIINEYDIEAWWQYIKSYDEACLSGTEASMLNCSVKTMSKVHIDSERIDDCIRRSFDNPNLDTCTQNRLLDAEETEQTADGAFIFPSVFIDGFMYRGNLVPGKGLFEAICESFNTLPDVCVEHFEAPPTPTFSSLPIETRHWPTVLATLGFLVVFGLFVFCCYKRHLKKEMYRQMVRDVNIAVSQYIAFKDEDVPKAEEAE